MEVKNHYSFELSKSIERMNRYLSEAEDTASVEEIPSRDEFSYDNGYYVQCCAVFIDMRHSSELTDEMSKKRAARIYRSFISEMTAVLQSFQNCKEINFAGDCVSGIFDATKEDDIYNVFMAVAKLNSQVMLLNNRLKDYNFPEISVGIGVNYGQALVVMSGYKGSDLKDLIWTGDVVNEASHACDKAGKDGNLCIIATKEFYDKLGSMSCKRVDGQWVPCKSFLEELGQDYQGDFWFVEVERWIDSH